MKDALLEFARRKMRFLIAIALLLVLTIALFIAVDGYQEPEIAAAQQKWSGLRGQVALTGLKDVSVMYQRDKADLDKLRERIPFRRQFPQLLAGILEQAASSGVTTGAITYKPRAISDEKLLAYELAMGVSGKYAAVKSFLADLQKNRELVIVDDVGWMNSDAFEENVTMDLRLTIYLREES